jgi:hypothetical protein
MGYKLHALFLETEKKICFYKYFWEGLDAINVGEAAGELINQNVTGYRIEEHRVSKTFDINDMNQYFQLAENYELLS